MPDPARQRAFALEIVQKLRAAGFEALWAGGCVRDELLGLAPKDYDVATSATPDQIRDLFGRRRTLPIGAAFGVVTVLGPRAAGQIEVATFRTDAAYSDGRHPDSVTFTDAEHDAQRRDFTINGLFFDPVAEKVVDYVGGQEDLKRRIIRAIGDPRLRLSEDKLRMLRAVRFAATFDFAIEPDTLRAIQEMAAEINTVSAERIGMEIRRMLVDPNRAAALQLLRETNLLPHVLPEVADLADDAFRRNRRASLAALRHADAVRSRSPRSAAATARPRCLAAPRRSAAACATPTKKSTAPPGCSTTCRSIAQAPQLPWPQAAAPAHPRRRRRAPRAARSRRRPGRSSARVLPRAARLAAPSGSIRRRSSTAATSSATASRPAHNSPRCSNKSATPSSTAKSRRATKPSPSSTVCAKRRNATIESCIAELIAVTDVRDSPHPKGHHS